MNEKIRVGASIVVWCVFLLLMLVGGTYIFITKPLPVVAEDDAVVGKDDKQCVLERVSPQSVGLSEARLANIDRVVEEAIAEGAIPGAVVGVVRDGKVAFAEAYGFREVGDSSVPMTIDTRFDLASLTKPIATATSVMQLVEQGRLSLRDRVDRYIPNFRGWTDEESQCDTAHIRIMDLLTHTSGLPPYVSTERIKREYIDAELPNIDTVIDYIANVERIAKPRSISKYSCLNYVTLAYVVEKITGERFDEYVTANIFEPLGMHSTCFMPDEEYVKKCAPTSPKADSLYLFGVVHDPLARECAGGVSGNAGLFSTFDDLAIYSAMLLNGGEWQGVEVLSPLGVATMLRAPRGYEQWGCTLGWWCCDSYSGVGGDLFTDCAVGHTGATGTSMVIDPELNLALIILTNYRHLPDSNGVAELRSRVASIVAASVRE